MGDVLKRNGDNWVVERVEHAIDGTCLVSVRPGMPHAGATGIGAPSTSIAAGR